MTTIHERDNNLPEFPTIEQGADYLQVSKPTIYKLAKDGKVKLFSIDGVSGTRLSRENLQGLFYERA